MTKEYDEMKSEQYAALDIEIAVHDNDHTTLHVGDITICVLHDIEIDREHQTTLVYENGLDKEIPDGCDYTATVKVKYTSVVFAELMTCEIVLPQPVLDRVIALIETQAEEQAEADDNEEPDYDDGSFDNDDYDSEPF